jgi:hypothetical protein
MGLLTLMGSSGLMNRVADLSTVEGTAAVEELAGVFAKSLRLQG